MQAVRMSASRQTAQDDAAKPWPKISTLGVDAILVSFGDRLSETANRAALAFRDAVERENLIGLSETSTSLVSTLLKFDPDAMPHATLIGSLQALLESRDWFDAALPQGRRLWRIPTVYGTTLAPQLEEAATAAGLSPAQAIAQISSARVRVQTIGFAPGQPYLGELPPEWNIPRQQALTEKVPVGALVVAIRQLVLFSVSTPTGWRHIGQTGFRLFRPEQENPFVLRPGDEVIFEAVDREVYERMKTAGADAGATSQVIP